MGAYLSAPNRDKNSVDYDGKYFSYGACSMQGWRMSQEDSHNCCEDFDKNTSLFAVYDGHGGSEVAQYTAVNFPDFIKNIPAYKDGQTSQALEDAFLQFDAHLTEEEVIHKLKELAGVAEDGEEPTEEEHREEVAGLFEEANMPLEKLLERYQGGPKQLRDLRKKENVPSPALRGKNDPDKNKESVADIKANLDDKLMNGDVVECNGKNHPSNTMDTETTDIMDPSVKDDSSKNKSESETAANDNIKVKNESETSVKTKDNNLEDKKDLEKNCSKKDSSEEIVTGSKDINVESSSNNGSSAISGSNLDQIAGSNSKTADKVLNDKEVSGSEDPVVKVDMVSDVKSENEATPSTQTGDKDTTCPDSSSSPSEPMSTSSSKNDTNSEAQVSSSTEGQGSGSVSQGQGSAGGQDVSGSADSSSKEVACSSTGRKRSGRTGVIPAEGEDETSEEEETTTDDDSDDEDMEHLEEEDSSDLDDDEDDLEGEDEEEDGTGIMYGGEEPGADSGCTAVVALLRGRELFVANAGDSRCVVCRDGKAVDMSDDHKPEDELELKRIVTAGGHVTPEGRVNGGLNLSRALGDHAYKRTAALPLREQMITALPDVRTLTLEDKDEFMVLACDGIWNSLSSQDTVNFVRDRLKGDVTKLSTICEEMFEFILAPDTGGDGTGCDNMTCIIIRFTDDLRSLASITDTGATKRPATETTDSDNASETVVCNKKPKEGD